MLGKMRSDKWRDWQEVRVSALAQSLSAKNMTKAGVRSYTSDARLGQVAGKWRRSLAD